MKKKFLILIDYPDLLAEMVAL